MLFRVFFQRGMERSGGIFAFYPQKLVKSDPVYRAFERCGEVNVTRGIVYRVEQGKNEQYLRRFKKSFNRSVPAKHPSF